MKNDYHSKATSRKYRGFTLVELMVGMALGIVLVGGVAGMYLETRKNMQQDGELARLQENARFALDYLRFEISASGFFGGSPNNGLSAEDIVDFDCFTGDSWVLVLDNPLELLDNVSTGAGPVIDSGHTLDCLPIDDFVDQSDIVLLKRTAGEPTLSDGQIVTSDGTEDLDQWYIKVTDYSDYSFEYLTTAIPADEKTAGSAVWYWEYYTKLIFIRDYSFDEDDGIPTMCEYYLVEFHMETQCLVEGIEDMQFELGVDADSNGVADLYVSNPTAAQLENAVSVRAHILVRSIDDLPGYTNNKTYQLGDKSIAAFNDGFLRKVFTTTIKLRNQVAN